MKEFGINNVRGGSYSQPILTSKMILEIKLKIFNLQTICTICDNKDYVVGKCNHIINENDFVTNYYSDSESDINDIDAEYYADSLNTNQKFVVDNSNNKHSVYYKTRNRHRTIIE